MKFQAISVDVRNAVSDQNSINNVSFSFGLVYSSVYSSHILVSQLHTFESSLCVGINLNSTPTIRQNLLCQPGSEAVQSAKVVFLALLISALSLLPSIG